MSKVLVVADDLTGAAEMAGIGAAYGLKARVTRGPGAGDAEMLVLDTDTRAMRAEDAAVKVRMALRQWAPGAHDLIYKKTDSVLRGQVAAEVEAMMEVLGRKQALLVPQNPSKGRVIAEGEYRIDGVPLDQTSFRFDPESPISSSRPEKILLPHKSDGIFCVRAGENLPETGIFIGEGGTQEDMGQWAARVDAATMPAGGADFFRALLEVRGFILRAEAPIPQKAERTLIVCGSAAEYSRNTVGEWIGQKRPVCPMPEDVFAAPAEATSAARWAEKARDFFQQRGVAILAIRHAITPARAGLLRHCTAATAEQLIRQSERSILLRLIIEGGATAAAITARMHWDNFDIAGNIAPGVVALHPHEAPHVLMIIKPGSYPWPAGLIPSV